MTPDNFVQDPTRYWRSNIFGRQCEWCAKFYYGDHDVTECRESFVSAIRAAQRMVKEG